MHPPPFLPAGLVALTLVGPLALPSQVVPDLTEQPLTVQLSSESQTQATPPPVEADVAVELGTTPSEEPAQPPPSGPSSETRPSPEPALVPEDPGSIASLVDGPPVAAAFGIAVVTAQGEMFFGPTPLAQAGVRMGHAEQWADAADVLVQGPSGVMLAKGRELRNVVVTHGDTWAAQGRAMARVGEVDLLNGLVRVEALESHVFASSNQRSTAWRGNADASIAGRVFVAGAVVPVAVDATIPLPGVGVLRVNETFTDPSTGLVAHYGVHLSLDAGLEVYVAGALVRTARTDTSPEPLCVTWSEAFPVQVRSLASSVDGKARVAWVPADIMGDGHADGVAGGVPLPPGGPVEAHRAAATHHGAIRGNNTTRATAFADTQAELLGVRVLGGLVEAEMLRATAHVAIEQHGPNFTIEANHDGTRLARLLVAGQEVTVEAGASQVVRVPATGDVVATVYLQESTTRLEFPEGGGALAVQRTNAVRVVVTGVGLGLPVGAEVVLGHAITIAQCGSHAMPPMDFGDPFRPA